MLTAGLYHTCFDLKCDFFFFFLHSFSEFRPIEHSCLGPKRCEFYDDWLFVSGDLCYYIACM